MSEGRAGSALLDSRVEGLSTTSAVERRTGRVIDAKAPDRRLDEGRDS